MGLKQQKVRSRKSEKQSVNEQIALAMKRRLAPLYRMLMFFEEIVTATNFIVIGTSDNR